MNRYLIVIRVWARNAAYWVGRYLELVLQDQPQTERGEHVMREHSAFCIARSMLCVVENVRDEVRAREGVAGAESGIQFKIEIREIDMVRESLRYITEGLLDCVCGATEADARDAADEDEDEDEDGCEGHESTSGPVGNVVYCDGSCVVRV